MNITDSNIVILIILIFAISSDGTYDKIKYDIKLNIKSLNIFLYILLFDKYI